jgi:hypothetical protein
MHECALIGSIMYHIDKHNLGIEMSNHHSATFNFSHYTHYPKRPKQSLYTFMQGLLDQRARDEEHKST